MSGSTHQGQATWTPLHLELMLHHHAIAEPFPQDTFTIVQYRQDLIDAGLLTINEESGGGFSSTQRGKGFVDLLCSTPPPVAIWVDPRFGKPVSRCESSLGVGVEREAQSSCTEWHTERTGEA